MYNLPGALVVVGAGVVVGATYGGALKDKERFVGGAWRKKIHCLILLTFRKGFLIINSGWAFN